MELSQYNNKFVVYLMTFPNGKKYCGYSSNIKRRWRNANEYKGQRVYKAIEKYGWENIKKEILYIFDNKQEALNKEHEVIDEMRLLDSDKGYNDVPGGGEPPHGLQYVSEQGYKNMQANGKRLANEIWNNPEKAEYSKKRMSEVDKAIALSLTPQERKERYGKHNIGRIASNAKPIYQIDSNTNEIIKEFLSAGLAAEFLGDRTYGANIRRVANGKGKIAYGYKWRWKDEDNGN